MTCMKCGREIPEDAAFCGECLEGMEKYPVKPGTAVNLPPRKEQPILRKASKRRSLPPEDQVRILRRRVRVLAAVVLLLLGFMCFLIEPAAEHYFEEHLKPGQNYSVMPHSTNSTKGA